MSSYCTNYWEHLHDWWLSKSHFLGKMSSRDSTGIVDRLEPPDIPAPPMRVKTSFAHLWYRDINLDTVHVVPNRFDRVQCFMTFEEGQAHVSKMETFFTNTETLWKRFILSSFRSSNVHNMTYVVIFWDGNITVIWGGGFCDAFRRVFSLKKCGVRTEACAFGPVIWTDNMYYPECAECRGRSDLHTGKRQSTKCSWELWT